MKNSQENNDDQDFKEINEKFEEIVDDPFPTLKSHQQLQERIRELKEKQKIYKPEHPSSLNRYAAHSFDEVKIQQEDFHDCPSLIAQIFYWGEMIRIEDPKPLQPPYFFIARFETFDNTVVGMTVGEFIKHGIAIEEKGLTYKPKLYWI